MFECNCSVDFLVDLTYLIIANWYLSYGMITPLEIIDPLLNNKRCRLPFEELFNSFPIDPFFGTNFYFSSDCQFSGSQVHFNAFTCSYLSILELNDLYYLLKLVSFIVWQNCIQSIVTWLLVYDVRFYEESDTVGWN